MQENEHAGNAPRCDACSIECPHGRSRATLHSKLIHDGAEQFNRIMQAPTFGIERRLGSGRQAYREADGKEQ